MYDNGVHPPIPFEMNSEEQMQFAEVAHLEFALEARLQLIDHVHIVCHHDKVVHMYNYNYNVVASLHDYNEWSAWLLMKLLFIKNM